MAILRIDMAVLPISFSSIILSLYSGSTSYDKAALDTNWQQAMAAELEALEENHTWSLVDKPPGCTVIGN